MNNTENDTPEFKDKTEALEFMVSRSIDRKRKEKWAKEFEVARNKKKPAKNIFLRRRLLQVSAIAATLILGFAVVQFLPLGQSNINDLASNMIENTKFQPQEVTRGAVLSEVVLNKSLKEALASEDYDEALVLYGQKSNPLSVEGKFFYAVSLAKTSNNQDATILELTADIMSTKNEFFIESLWLSALSHLKLNKTEIAKNELEQLLRYKYQTQNVKKLLAKISD